MAKTTPATTRPSVPARPAPRGGRNDSSAPQHRGKASGGDLPSGAARSPKNGGQPLT